MIDMKATSAGSPEPDVAACAFSALKGVDAADVLDCKRSLHLQQGGPAARAVFSVLRLGPFRVPAPAFAQSLAAKFGVLLIFLAGALPRPFRIAMVGRLGAFAIYFRRRSISFPLRSIFGRVVASPLAQLFAAALLAFVVFPFAYLVPVTLIVAFRYLAGSLLKLLSLTKILVRLMPLFGSFLRYFTAFCVRGIQFLSSLVYFVPMAKIRLSFPFQVLFRVEKPPFLFGLTLPVFVEKAPSSGSFAGFLPFLFGRHGHATFMESYGESTGQVLGYWA